MSAADPLARPVWNMLNGPRASLAIASGAAVRIDPRFGPFAAARDGSPEAQRALGALLKGPGDRIWTVEADETPAPPGARVARSAALVQMVFDGPAAAAADEDREIELLGEADQEAMAALAFATEPGPWGSLTHRYGAYYGIRDEDGLRAMAGERMLPAPGFAEVSGVATWPQWRGRGYATRLIRRVMAGFCERGDTPFLHTYASNSAAIALYESLGYRLHRTLVVTILEAV